MSDRATARFYDLLRTVRCRVTVKWLTKLNNRVNLKYDTSSPDSCQRVLGYALYNDLPRLHIALWGTTRSCARSVASVGGSEPAAEGRLQRCAARIVSCLPAHQQPRAHVQSECMPMMLLTTGTRGSTTCNCITANQAQKFIAARLRCVMSHAVQRACIRLLRREPPKLDTALPRKLQLQQMQPSQQAAMHGSSAAATADRRAHRCHSIHEWVRGARASRARDSDPPCTQLIPEHTRRVARATAPLRNQSVFEEAACSASRCTAHHIVT